MERERSAAALAFRWARLIALAAGVMMVFDFAVAVGLLKFGAPSGLRNGSLAVLWVGGKLAALTVFAAAAVALAILLLADAHLAALLSSLTIEAYVALEL